MGDGVGEGVLGLLAGGGGLLAGGVLAGDAGTVLAGSATSAQLAAYLSVSKRQINRQIHLGMSSLAAAELWRKTRPSPHVPGVAKRQRLDGEVSAVAMATALGISATRVHQLWKDGMPRTSVLLAKDYMEGRAIGAVQRQPQDIC